MRVSKKPLSLALALFIGATLFVVHSVKNLAWQNRTQVRDELQKWLGRKASFEELEVNLLSGFGFSAKELRIADNPRFAATPLVRARELKLGVSIGQLLLGRLVVNSLTFHDPELQIITDEDGRLNLSALAIREDDPASLPKLRGSVQERKLAPAQFAIRDIRLKNGRIDFINRSVKEPAELQIRNVQMEISGLDLGVQTRIKFGAAVTEGLTHDVKIDGRFGPLSEGAHWLQQPAEFEMEFDSLQLPLLTRAIPFLRNKIPRELNVAGPFYLRASMAGTLQRPRITNIIVKGLLFGSSDYNTVLTGSVDFSGAQSWSDAQLKGKLVLNPVNFADLSTLPFLDAVWPAALAADGPISISNQFEGSWSSLRIGTLISAHKTNLRYAEWFRKPAGTPLDLRARISRVKNRFILHESTLNLGYSKLLLSGNLADIPEPRLQLRVRNEGTALTSWKQIVLFPLSFHAAGGTVAWDLVFANRFPAKEGGWDIRGKLTVNDAEFRQNESGKKIDQLKASIRFSGTQAVAESASFRLGSSVINLAAIVPVLGMPKATYKAFVVNLNPTDLPAVPSTRSSRITRLNSEGEIELHNGMPLLRGGLSSPQGYLYDRPYRNLQAYVTWSPNGINFKNVSLQTLNGTLQSQGLWTGDASGTREFKVNTQVDSVDLRDVLMQEYPRLADRINGRLKFRGELSGTTENSGNFRPTLKGSGETVIYRGTIKDFNPIAILIPRTGASGISNVSTRLPPTLVGLLDRKDTDFDTLQVNFVIDQQRFRTENLALSTPDYLVTASGSVGFDGATKGSGVLVLSPRVTQELQREFKMVRYLLDRRGRLSIGFRMDGKLPNIGIKPDNPAVAQVFGRSTHPSESDGASGKEQDKKPAKEWLPKALEDWLNR